MVRPVHFLKKELGFCTWLIVGKVLWFCKKQIMNMIVNLKKKNPWFYGDMKLMVCSFRQKWYVLSDKNGSINSMSSASKLG